MLNHKHSFSGSHVWAYPGWACVECLGRIDGAEGYMSCWRCSGLTHPACSERATHGLPYVTINVTICKGCLEED